MIRIFLLVMFLTTQVSAQTMCWPREIVLTVLEEKHGEERKIMGLIGDDLLVEVFASKDRGNWTITTTMLNGITCIILSGHSFENLK